MVERCQGRHCEQAGIGYNDDGEFLCEEHMEDWYVEEDMRMMNWAACDDCGEWDYLEETQYGDLLCGVCVQHREEEDELDDE
jgi:formylmethanofuran dehydrogenase subunit E